MVLACIFYFADIDECTEETDTCADIADCTNTDGSFTCTCPDGYTGSGEICTGKHWSQTIII